jgi:arylsulfatase A-like enzyme
VIFTRAATVAPWTLPSHATLLTGRYPWEHGVMGAGRLSFDRTVPTLPRLLRPRGYTSLALSANGMLTPLLGLEGAYDAYRAAEWWEKTFRWLDPERIDLPAATGSRSGRAALSVLTSAALRRRHRRTPTELLRMPGTTTTLAQAVHETRPEEAPLGPTAESLSWAVIDGMNRIARTLKSPEDPRPLPVAPWIEPTLAGWLARRPPDSPVHCFVNFLDAHEKYLSDAEIVRGLGGWRSYLRIAQNARLWLQGDWRPTDAELGLLRELYQRTIHRLDLRLGALVEVLRRADRWENTLLVVTSDHGQAFGEHDDLFHERSPYESLLHVPLWIRWPGGDGGGHVRNDVVSLVDIVPTVLKAAGGEAPSNLPGRPLDAVIPRTSEDAAVLAMADGFPSIEHFRGNLSEGPMIRLNRSYAVAYSGDFKVVLNLHDERAEVYNLTRDPEERTVVDSPPEGDASHALGSARDLAQRIRNDRSGMVDERLENQLRSWGY